MPGRPSIDALQHSLSVRFRNSRDVHLRRFIETARAARGRADAPFRIIDLGGNFSYWARFGVGFLDAQNIEILCVNPNALEFGTPNPHPGRLQHMIGDACALPEFATDSFDMVHSNSVIEHVGGFADMQRFAAEALRLAPAHYIQTPYYWCPIDPHFPRIPFLHWLPQPWQLRLLRTVQGGWVKPVSDVARAMRLVESSVMLDRLRFRYLFPHSQHRFEWAGPIPKSMIAEALRRPA